MTYILRFEEGSLDDFKDGITYYEKISSSFADNFYKEFWDIIDYIKENPLHFQIRYRNIRIAMTKVFPFGIHFIIEGDKIFIQRILHNKRFYKD